MAVTKALRMIRRRHQDVHSSGMGASDERQAAPDSASGMSARAGGGASTELPQRRRKRRASLLRMRRLRNCRQSEMRKTSSCASSALRSQRMWLPCNASANSTLAKAKAVHCASFTQRGVAARCRVCVNVKPSTWLGLHAYVIVWLGICDCVRILAKSHSQCTMFPSKIIPIWKNKS